MLALAFALAVLEPASVPPTLAETFASQVQPVLVTTLVGVAIALAGFIAYAIKVLIGRAKLWVDGLSDNAAWRAANAKLELAAVAGVEAAEQTLARQLRAIEPLGKLDAVQGEQVLRAAVEAARAHFGPTAWTEIGAVMEKNADDLAALLRHKIEAAVFRSKPPAGAITGSVVEIGGMDVGSPSPEFVARLGAALDAEAESAARRRGEPTPIGPDDSTVREVVTVIGAGDSGPTRS